MAKRRYSKPSSAGRKHSADARDFKVGDDTYNARRREYRAAKRYLDKAYESAGATRDKYRQIAREHFENALDTYDPSTKQDFSAPMKRLAAELGADINKRRSEFVTGGKNAQARQQKQFEEQRERRISESLYSTEKAMQDSEIRREREAGILMSGELGRRIMAGLVDVWSDVVSKDNTPAENRRLVEQAVFEYFNVDKWSDVIAALEKSIGESLYKISGNEDFYDVVKTMIQDKVMDNTLIV